MLRHEEWKNMETFTVTTLLDRGPGSLRQAILSANGRPGPDRIVFAVAGTITLHSPLPPITDPLIINGPGADGLAISGNGEVQILTVERGVNVAIDGITFQDGRTVNGGAIHNRGRLTLSACAFRRNFAGNDGGAILNDGGILLVRDCTFDGNQAEFDGGAISNRLGDLLVECSRFNGNAAGSTAGGIHTATGLTTVRKSKFSGHSAPFGGTFALFGTRLEIADCEVTDSTAATEGGAARVTGEAEITGSFFLRNRAGSMGGAITAFRGTLRVCDTQFRFNRAGLDGGAVASLVSTTVVRCCLLADNEAGDSGGAIATIDEVLRVEDSDLIRNAASGFGGAIRSFLNTNGTWVGIFNTNFLANAVQEGGGGAISTFGGATEVIGCALARNSGAFGGAIHNGGGTLTRLLNATLSQNIAATTGGAIFLSGGMAEASFVTINESLVLQEGGAAVAGARLFMANSIIASTTNGLGQPRPNSDGRVTDLGGNFSTDDTCPGFTVVSAEEPALGQLLIHAPRRTCTHALGEGSVAIGGARNCLDAALQPVGVDQRGVRRPQGRACDAGAYEAAWKDRPEHDDGHRDGDQGSGGCDSHDGGNAGGGSDRRDGGLCSDDDLSDDSPDASDRSGR